MQNKYAKYIFMKIIIFIEQDKIHFLEYWIVIFNVNLPLFANITTFEHILKF